MEQKSRKSLVSIMRVLALRGLGVAMSLGTAIGMAFFFGAGPLSDAFFLIRRLFGSLTLLIQDLFTVLMVPKYVQNSQNASMREFLLTIRKLEIQTFIGGVLLATVCVLFSHQVINSIAPGISPDTAQAAALYFILMALTLPITISTSVTAAALSAIRHFSLPVAVRLLPRALIILAVLMVPIGMGMTGIVWAAVLGHVFMGMILFISKRRLMRSDAGQLQTPSSVSEQSEVVSSAVSDRAGAFVLLGVYFVIVTISESYFASYAGIGAIAILALGQRISNLGMSEMLNSLLAVYYTNFSENARNPEAFRTDFHAALRTGMFFAMPLCTLLIVLGPTLSQLMLANGAFSEAAATAAGGLIAWFALGAIANTFMSVMETAILAYNSDQKSKHFMLACSATLAARIGVIMTLLPVMGLNAIGLAAVFAPVMMSFFNYRYLSRRIEKMVTKDVILAIVKVFGAGLFAGATAYFIIQVAPSEYGKWSDLIALIAASTIAAMVYLAITWALCLPESRELIAGVLKKLRH